jgi:hypothetical protein
MRHRLRLPGPSMVVALVALFVALSGTAVAAGVPALAKRALVADNAKKLGGQTSAQLLSAAKQQAESAASAAAQQPGPASTAAGLVAIKTATWNLNPNGQSDFTVTCDAGSKAVGGGWEDPNGWGHSWDSRPTPDGASWKIFITVSSNAPGGQSGTLYAVCLK